MQVSLKILVVIRPMKIKQKIKTRWVVSVVSFTQLRALTGIMSTSVRFTANTQITNFSFQVMSTSKIIIFQFFGLYLHFFLEWMETHLFGRALPRSHKLFPLLLDYFCGCVLEETHGSTNVTWKSEGSAKCGEEICNWVVRNKKLMKNKV